MTDDEIIKVVEHLNACWNTKPDDIKAQRRAWKVFIHDLNFGNVMETINRLALTATYQPRPGEIRRLMLAPSFLTGIEAWAQLQSVRKASQSGITPQQLDTAVKDTIRRIGDIALGLQSNGDRDMFINAYNTTIEELIQESCQTK